MCQFTGPPKILQAAFNLAIDYEIWKLPLDQDLLLKQIKIKSSVFPDALDLFDSFLVLPHRLYGVPESTFADSPEGLFQILEQ